jgi:hypothetical protein
MTRKRRRPTHQTEAMRFLLEDFVAVPADESERTTVSALDIAGLRKDAGRFLLPKGQRWLFSPERMTGDAFQRLRRLVAGRLRMVAVEGSTGPHRLRISIMIPKGAKQGDPLYVEPSIESPITGMEDLVWLYVAQLVMRAGPSRIGICPAPRSKRSPGQGPYCGNLFFRRGEAKVFCSDTCRARVATRRARNPPKGKGGDR